MSDAEHAKKLFEIERLGRFLDAYGEVTGIRMHVLDSGERPDFLCVLPDGSPVGVELTRSPHDFETRSHDKIWSDMSMDYFDLLDAIHTIIASKSKKLKEPNWRSDQTILVVFLEDYAFESYDWIDDGGIESDFEDYGFAEIWLADCSTIEPFNAVRLIGLHPQRHWGLFDQPSLTGKPFG
ncbi:MAG: hypothetical protein J0M04_24380 [Verrucomicrobia bacterium]|nr:hypothetical protein [Verrucomicrobiota bacterium]